MNHAISDLTRSLIDLRKDLLLEVEKIPNEQIPQLLRIIRLFRQTQMTSQESVDNWEKAMERLKNPIQFNENSNF